MNPENDDRQSESQDAGSEGPQPPPADQAAKLRAAAEAVRRAEGELHAAERCCQTARRQIAQRADALRKTTLGDVLDAVIATVRKYPVSSAAVVAAFGFLFGRISRK
jgi:hypothetical protein